MIALCTAILCITYLVQCYTTAPMQPEESINMNNSFCADICFIKCISAVCVNIFKKIQCAPNTSLKLKFSLHSENKERKNAVERKKSHCKVISFCV